MVKAITTNVSLTKLVFITSRGNLVREFLRLIILLSGPCAHRNLLCAIIFKQRFMQVELISFLVLKYHKLEAWQVGGAVHRSLWWGPVTDGSVTDKSHGVVHQNMHRSCAYGMDSCCVKLNVDVSRLTKNTLLILIWGKIVYFMTAFRNPTFP